MAKITAKNKDLTGYALGVEFVNGVGETNHPAALAFFGRSGDYTVDEKKTVTRAPRTHTPASDKDPKTAPKSDPTENE